MDFYKLQKKLFELEPVDPRKDYQKLKESLNPTTQDTTDVTDLSKLAGLTEEPKKPSLRQSFIKGQQAAQPNSLGTYIKNKLDPSDDNKPTSDNSANDTSPDVSKITPTNLSRLLNPDSVAETDNALKKILSNQKDYSPREKSAIIKSFENMILSFDKRSFDKLSLILSNIKRNMSESKKIRKNSIKERLMNDLRKKSK